MSTLLEQASLVMIPSGYKEDIVYSQIPTNGNGDLTFTRASNGTRINSAGLVEVCPWNMVTYSEQFTQYPPWLIQNITRADNVTTAPNGTTTAGKIYPSTTSSNPVMYSTAISVVSGQNYAVSIYAKVAGKNWIFIRTVDDSSAGVWFNLSTGVIGTQTSATGIIESVGNGWYRCTVIGAPTTTTGRCVYLVVDSNGSITGTASGTDGIYIWGAQLNIGSTAKPYFPTTDRLNVPRLTYQNGGGGCPSLLLEKQSTNLVTYSEQLDNADWTKANGSGGSAPIVTANYGISPDGTQNADRIQLARTTSGNSYSEVYQSKTVTSGQTYTFSVWLKSLSGTPTIGFASQGTNVTTYTATLTNDWVRYTYTATALTTSIFADLILWQSVGATSLTADFLAWGYQIEASSYPTSYIPTTSSSATRVADACFKTGISSLIGQSEGVLFVDYVLNGQTNNVNILNSEKNTNCSFFMAQKTNGKFDAGLYVSGSVVGRIEQGNLSVGQRYKVAYAYKSGSFALYINGVQLGILSNTFTLPTTFDDIFLNDPTTYFNYQEAVKYNQVALFPTRLTNAELASLTTL